MATKPVDLHRLNLDQRGSLNFKREGDTQIRRWVYQRTSPSYGNLDRSGGRANQLRRWVNTEVPITPAVLAARAVFAQGVHAWQALTILEREPYNERAKKLRLSGYNLWMHEWKGSVASTLYYYLVAPQQADNLFLAEGSANATGELSANLQSADIFSGEGIVIVAGTLESPNATGDTLDSNAVSIAAGALETPNQQDQTIAASAGAIVAGALSATNQTAQAVTASGKLLIVWVNNTTDNTAGSRTSITIAKPAGLEVGDLMIANISHSQTTTRSPPAGWTNGASWASGRGVWQMYKYATAADVSASNFTFNVSPSQVVCGEINRLRSPHPSSPSTGYEQLDDNAADPLAGSVLLSLNEKLVMAVHTQTTLLQTVYTPSDGYSARANLQGIGSLGLHAFNSATFTKMYPVSGSVTTVTFDSGNVNATDYRSILTIINSA